MAVVDHEAAWADLRGELRRQRLEDGRTSFGTPQLLELLDELEVRNRIDESHDRKVLRRFAGALVDTFLGLLPRATSTEGPLADDDQVTSPAMARGEDHDPTSREETHVHRNHHTAARG